MAKKSDVYQAALDAIAKNRPTKAAQARVEAFFEATDSASGAREEAFYTSLLQQSILGKDTLAGKVYDAAPRIGRLLASFIKGKPIPAKQKELVRAFLGYWRDFAKGEQRLYDVLCEMQDECSENPRLRRAARRAFAD